MSTNVKDDLAGAHKDSLSNNLDMDNDYKSQQSALERDFKAGVAKRLRDRRKELGWDQEMARIACGVTLSAYQKWENRSGIPAWHLPKACIALRVPSWWLLTGQKHEKHIESNRPKMHATEPAKPARRRSRAA